MDDRTSAVGDARLRTARSWGASFRRGKAAWLGFVLLLLIYVLASVVVVRISQSDSVILIMGSPTPVRTLAGVFSPLANITVIFLVLYFGRLGFNVSLVMLSAQLASLIAGMLRTDTFDHLPGICTTMLTVVAICLIERYNDKVERYQERIVEQAVTDRLTGLPNRFACSELIGDLVETNRRFCFCALNLANFKSINSALGPSCGDQALIEVARRLSDVRQNSSTTNDFIAYQGADEFAVIVRDYEDVDEVRRSLACYERAMETPLTLEDCDFFLGTHMGFAEYPSDAMTPDELMAYATIAMQKARHEDQMRSIVHFTTGLYDIEQMLATERTIRHALEHDLVTFNLQPQFDMDHRLIGFEALARMRDAEGNPVSPVQFVPVAERVGLIDQIDLSVFRKSAAFFVHLVHKTGIDATLSVNASVRHLMKNDFVDEVTGVLASCGLDPRRLEIEITESIMIDSVDKALERVHELRAMGIRIAIDDFGTGYSSLSYLNSFPADVLKVDKSFIDKMNTDESSEQYVAAIISIGHVMGFGVICEGIESERQLMTLRVIGCDYIQGYLWGRPLEAEAALDLALAQSRQSGLARFG